MKKETSNFFLANDVFHGTKIKEFIAEDRKISAFSQKIP